MVMLEEDFVEVEEIEILFEEFDTKELLETEEAFGQQQTGSDWTRGTVKSAPSRKPNTFAKNRYNQLWLPLTVGPSPTADPASHVPVRESVQPEAQLNDEELEDAMEMLDSADVEEIESDALLLCTLDVEEMLTETEAELEACVDVDALTFG